MKRYFYSITMLFVLGAGLMTSGELRADPRRYAVIELGNLGDQWVTSAYALNDRASVVGASFTVSGDPHPTIWRGGVLTDLDPALSGGGEAWGVNESDQVVGWAEFDQNFDMHAFLWEDGIMLDLGTLGGAWSQAYGINNAGQIVGESQFTLDEYYNQPFVWEKSVMRSLTPDCDECRGRAWAINDAGQIVGYATVPELNIEKYPVLWHPDGEMIVLHEGGGQARGINNLGQVVGKTGYTDHAVLWEPDGTMIELEDGGIGPSLARDINDHGIIVGHDGSPGSRAPCIWDEEGKRFTIRRIIAPRNKWRIDVAFDINNNNQIAARGSTSTGSNVDYAFLLTPVTPRFGITEPVPGIAGEMNEMTARGGDLEPGMRVNFYWGVHGGGTMFPTNACDILDAVLQIENARWAGSAIADENGIATLRGTIPMVAKDQIVLFQAMVPARYTSNNKCMQSSFVVTQFE